MDFEIERDKLRDLEMKRGKDYDKIMGPMFPRLHVNDTDKGGPRAPPRNKMALYEQLSIPSQRFNPDVLPRNSSNTSDLAPTGSSSQVLSDVFIPVVIYLSIWIFPLYATFLASDVY